jgi:gamma-glutamyltranspeptidase/glutathione hydrolase
MKLTKKSLAVLTALSILFSFVIVPSETIAAWREPVRGRHSMVASQHEIASKVGAETMKKGGNAIDAAIAVAFALAVVYPEAGNLGGGGFMLIRFKDGRTTAIDYREMAPAASHRDVYLDQNGKLIEGEGSPIVGYRAAGVPGTLAGLELAFKKYGSKKISWAEIVEPARRLAHNGYVVSNSQANLLKIFEKNLAQYEDSKKIFLNGGNFYAEGDNFKQPELAQTLARIQEAGVKEFYEGQTARLIAADMKRHNGLITLEDLKNYRVKERAPIRGTYRGYEVISMPPPSSGGIVLLQTLNILEDYDLRRMSYNSSEKYHVLTEALRRSFADRAELLGDPDFTNVPTAQLIDKNYARQRSKTIDLNEASKSSKIGHGEPTGKEPMNTTNLTVIDAEGNVVANTYTLNNPYGSAVTAKGTGVLLNNEMDDFAAQPGKPNTFNLIQGEKNSVQPKKRPLSSMTPTIVLRKDSSLWFALGAEGGPHIITAVLQTIINMVDHDMNIAQAVEAPRIHHQWFPDEILYEPYGISTDTRRVLEKFGHNFAEEPANLATVTAIAIEEKTGVRLGTVDSRAGGKAVGY